MYLALFRHTLPHYFLGHSVQCLLFLGKLHLHYLLLVMMHDRLSVRSHCLFLGVHQLHKPEWMWHSQQVRIHGCASIHMWVYCLYISLPPYLSPSPLHLIERYMFTPLLIMCLLMYNSPYTTFLTTDQPNQKVCLHVLLLPERMTESYSQQHAINLHCSSWSHRW